MKKIIEARRNRPMFLIDIAVPRNIEPSVNELDNIFLYDIDDLQRVVDENLKGRMDQAAEADKIVAEEVERLEAWMRTRQVGPGDRQTCRNTWSRSARPRSTAFAASSGR